jgi:16S rRNA (cytidine1402-2'-O)-methyltransferase
MFDGQSIKGELVVLIDRARGSRFGPEEIEALLREKLAVMRVKDAAKEVSDAMGLARRDVYQLALKLTSGDGEADD